MHFSIERIWLNSYLQLVAEILVKVFIIHLINMHFNLLSLNIYNELLFYYIQTQKLMPFNKFLLLPHQKFLGNNALWSDSSMRIKAAMKSCLNVNTWHAAALPR